MRKVLRSQDEVAHFWANKVQYEGQASNLFFRDDIIFSYGERFPIARWVGDQTVLFTTRGHSPTTSCHKALVRRALPLDTRVIECSDVLARTQTEHEGNLKVMRDEIAELDDKVQRARQRRAMHLGQLVALIHNHNEYVAHFSVGGQISVDADVVAEAARLQAEAEAAVVELQRKQEERNREKVEAWLRGETSSCPHTLRPLLRLLPPYTRVETSWGAEVLIGDALKLWPLITAVKTRGTETYIPDHISVATVGAYRMERIESNGDIHIGCHRIEYSEIERIARQLGLLTDGTTKRRAS